MARPSKYKIEYENQVYKLCLLGATDKELADFLEISESTLNEWKIKYPMFSESIKRGKEIADATVAEKLYHRAIGYQHKETKIVSYEGEITDQIDIDKHYPPDPTAAIFWLKNRQPKSWRDKQEVESHNTNINYDMSKLTAEQLERIISMTDAKEIEAYYNQCIKGD